MTTLAKSDLSSPNLRSAQWWLDLNPSLTIGDRSRFNVAPSPMATEAALALPPVFGREGYVQMPHTQDAASMGALADAVKRIVGAGLPATFGFVYDQFWIPFCRLHSIIERLLGGPYCMLPDFWVWHVDPAKDESGWRPHRDRGRESLFPDGRAMSVTVWIPMTAAHPLNGCIYIVPAHRDPNYGTERESAEDAFKLYDIRALPAQPGDSLIWNQAVTHWGSHSSELATDPRVSMAFEFQRADVSPFNAPLIPSLTFLSFEQRLALLAKQIEQYSHMYKLTPEMDAFSRAWRDKPIV